MCTQHNNAGIYVHYNLIISRAMRLMKNCVPIKNVPFFSATSIQSIFTTMYSQGATCRATHRTKCYALNFNRN
jgi:hypothetical protein